MCHICIRRGKLYTLLANFNFNLLPAYYFFSCVLDGVVPRDSTLVIQLETTIPLSLYIPLSVLSSCGIILAVSFLVFNVALRANRFVMKSLHYVFLSILPSLFYLSTSLSNMQYAVHGQRLEITMYICFLILICILHLKAVYVYVSNKLGDDYIFC